MERLQCSFNKWIDKKDIVSISKSFPELKTSWERVKVELDLSNYATKSDLKNTASVDTSKLLKRLI